jgi:hypothetical protein
MKRAIFVLLGITVVLFSQNLQPPVSGPIVSDYGQRNWDGYDWHEGIDYDGDIWDEISTVEGGQISEIDYEQDGAGWYIRIQGTCGRWIYMHCYYDDANNNPISPDNRHEARMATLEDPTGQGNPEYYYIFIFWLDRNNNRAEKILSSRGNWYVRARPNDPGYDPNNPYILDQNGERILTQGSVADREVFAPLGTSGGVGSHVHIALNSPNRRYDINPLYYIIHPEPDYTLTIIQHPPVDAVFYHRTGAPEAQQLNERIRVNINSTQGLDLGVNWGQISTFYIRY